VGTFLQQADNEWFEKVVKENLVFRSVISNFAPKIKEI